MAGGKTLDIHRAMEIGARIARERDGINVVVGGTDPSIERHRVELYGAPTAPDTSPVDMRYVPPKTVLMEWVGEPSPFDSPLVQALRLKDLLTPIHRLVLGQVALLRRPRIDGVTSWTLGPRDGLTKTYRWGKQRGTFVVEVDFADVDRLLAIGQSGLARDLNQFRVVGSHADALPAVAPDEAWAKVIRKISKREGLPTLPAGAERLRVRSGTEEAYRGIDRAGHVWRS